MVYVVKGIIITNIQQSLFSYFTKLIAAECTTILLDRTGPCIILWAFGLQLTAVFKSMFCVHTPHRYLPLSVGLIKNTNEMLFMLGIVCQHLRYIFERGYQSEFK